MKGRRRFAYTHPRRIASAWIRAGAIMEALAGNHDIETGDVQCDSMDAISTAPRLHPDRT